MPGEYTPNPFANFATHCLAENHAVMDQITRNWAGARRDRVVSQRAQNGGMKREMRSPSYTTRLDQLWTVKSQWGLSAWLRGHSDNLSAGNRFQLSHFEQQALVYRSNPG